MKSVVGHGTLLIVALIVAWSTWTRDESVSMEEFQTTVWTADAEAVDSVTYAGGGRYLVVTRRNEDGDRYLWGWQVETALDSTGTPIPTRRDTSYFPVNAEAEDLLELVAPLQALRDLGTLESLSPERRSEYGLDTPEDTLVVHLSRGREERMFLGGVVFGGSGRYAVAPATGRAYAISGLLSEILESGLGRLRSHDLHAFQLDEVARVVLTTPRSEQIRVRTGGFGATSTWAAPETPARVDATFGNFMSRVVGLRPLAFVNALPADSLELLATLEYQDDDDDLLGAMEFFRGRDGEGGDRSYYLRTEFTRILAQPSVAQAERIAEDLDQLFRGAGGPQAAGPTDSMESLTP